MAGGVYEVEFVLLPIGSPVGHPHRRSFNGNPLLPLQVHLVEELLLHLAGVNGAGELQEPVCQGGFAVVYVGDDAEVADVPLIHNATPL